MLSLPHNDLFHTVIPLCTLTRPHRSMMRQLEEVNQAAVREVGLSEEEFQVRERERGEGGLCSASEGNEGHGGFI